MKAQAKSGGSVICDGVALAPSPPKSLGGAHPQKHISALCVCDGPQGNSVADSFELLPQLKLCFVAAAAVASNLPQEIGSTITRVPRFATHARTSNSSTPPASNKCLRRDPALMSPSSSSKDKETEGE